MKENEKKEDPFIDEVRRQAERSRKGQAMTFWQGLSLVGAVGWMVSLPAVVGALVGRWLDHRYATGIHWTLSLLVIGLALGCASAWRHARRDLDG